MTAMAVPTMGEGTTGNTAHINYSTALPFYKRTKTLDAYHQRIKAEEAERERKKAKARARAAKRRSRAAIKMNRLRRAMIIREIASMGFYGAKIARMCGTSKEYLLQLRREFNVTVPKRGRYDTDKFRAVRAGYEANKSAQQIALEAGMSENVVKNYASLMGVTYKYGRYTWRRGFIVPENRMAEYLEARRCGCTIKEAGRSLGLIPREQVVTP